MRHRLQRGERLLATMAAVPGAGAIHLPVHTRRLAASAEALGVPPDPAGWHRAVDAAVAGAAARVRLLVDVVGRATVDLAPLPPWSAVPVTLVVDDEPVDERDPRLAHKTTERRWLDERLRRHPGAGDVVLVNRRGEVTEATRANVVVRLDGRWWTPPAACGLLPGAGRAVLLARGVVGERVVARREWEVAEAVALVSSLRGWRPARRAGT